MDGSRIREVRMRAGVTMYALAKQAGLTEKGLAAVERGRRTASRQTLEALSIALAKPLNMVPSQVYSELTGIDETVSA